MTFDSEPNCFFCGKPITQEDADKGLWDGDFDGHALVAHLDCGAEYKVRTDERNRQIEDWLNERLGEG